MAVGGRQDWDVMTIPNNDLMVILTTNETDLKGMNTFMADVVRFFFFSFLRVMAGWRIFENRVGVCVIVDSLLKNNTMN